ncbi:MAG: mechanosensitive ion channel family protein [Spirochaetales bacterium]|nr:mechanosensitive ion channel family protein [Spirochaetales bacterium]
MRFTIFIALLHSALPASPLAPVKTDSPRDTMKTFMEAMQLYAEGERKKDARKKDRIEDAVRCLDLSAVPALMRAESGREAAIFLKEVIDRIILIDYEKIPGPDTETLRWRLKDTEITIVRVEEGERRGEFLFSADTVARAGSFYSRVRHLPYLPASGQGAHYQHPWQDRLIPVWAREPYLGLGLWQWVGIGLAILLGLMVRLIAHHLLELLRKLLSKTPTRWDVEVVNAAAPPAGWIVCTLIWALSILLLRLEGFYLSTANFLVNIFLSISIIFLTYRLVNVLTLYFQEIAGRTHSTLDDQLVPLFNRTLKILVLIMGSLLAIQNLGINVLSLLAGLGIGGLAFALAAKDAVANFFGSLMILFDRPFQVGDWIVVGAAEGTVEEIGFRSTRIRTFYNSVISIPNSEIANVKIDNMGMRKYRRIRTLLSLKYSTTPQTLHSFIEGVKEILRSHPRVHQKNYHVVFHEYAASSLDILLYCFLEVPDWSAELQCRQEIFTAILELSHRLGAEFAFPSRSLYLENVSALPQT